MGSAANLDQPSPKGGHLRYLFVFLLSIAAFYLCFLLYFFASARAQINTNPGDQYVFGADSPVYVFGLDQSRPALKNNIVLWSQYDSFYFPGTTTPSYRNRIFYKDLSKGPGEAGHALFENELAGEMPAISQGSNRLVWSEWNGSNRQLYVKDVDFSSYNGCQEKTLALCGAAPLPTSTYWQAYPAVSPDGNKVVWQDGTGSYPQIHYYDFNTGIDQVVNSLSMHDQEQPSVDNEWIVWSENWENNYFGWNHSAVYAKNIITGNLITVAQNSGSSNTSVDSAKLGHNAAGEPVIAYISRNYSNGTSELRIHNLSTGSDQQLISGNGRLDRPFIDGDKVVYQESVSGTNKIALYDLTSHVNQTVSQDSGRNPAVSASSKYIVWQNLKQTPYEIYYNRIGDTAQTFADRYKPELKMTNGENFAPMPVEQFLTAPRTILRKRYQDTLPETLQFRVPNPSAQDLAKFAATPDLFVDLSGNSIDAGGGDPSTTIDRGNIYDNYVRPYLDRRSQFPCTIYARLVSKPPDRASTAIQYWIFYYANDFSELFHEGDWELVQVDLDRNLQPSSTQYSSHGGGRWRHWNGDGAVEKSALSPDKPVVYVAMGSHANYYHAGEYGIAPLSWDVAGGDGDTINAPAKVIPEPNQATDPQFDWLNFQGQWGEYTGANVGIAGLEWGGFRDGPDNPPVQPYWNNAFAWPNVICDSCKDETADGTEAQLTVLSPVDIRIYDSQGRVMGKNLGPNDIPIPGAEYIEYPELHRKSIIIHGSDINPGYRIEADGTDTGTADFIVTAPDHPGGSVDTLNYNALQVNKGTKVTMTLDSTKNYTINVDATGDGTNVIQKTPDTTTTKSVDFTPPAKVPDLAAVGVPGGSAILSFTAPGDDGNTGAASSYDLRYSTSAITDQYWKDAIPTSGLPTTLAAGSTQTATINGLLPGTTYYFGLKAIDKVGLESPLSNIASARIPIATTTTGAATAVPSSLYSIAVSVPYTGDENSDGAALIQYKLSGDATWSEYGTVSHPSTTATIYDLTANASYDVYVTYQDPDGVNGTAGQQISAIQLPAPPSATNVGPSGTIFGGTATVNASLSAGYGINPAAVSVTLDGNLISGCTVTTSALSCLVSGLTFGPHVIGGSVGDNAGNTAPITGSFNVGDNTAPAVADVLPTDTVYGGSAIVGADYSDPGIASGIDTASVVVYLDGNEINSCTANETNVSCETSGLASGTHTISGSVADNSGNVTSFSGSFLMIEWSQASVIYQSGLIPSQPSLYQLTDGRTLLVYTEQFTNTLKFEVSSDGVNWQVPQGSTGTIPYAAGTQPSITQLSSGQIVVSYANYVYNPFLGHYVWNIAITSSNDLINWSWPSGAWVSDSLAPTVTALDNNQMLLTYARQTAPNPGNIDTKIGIWNGSYFSWGLSETLVYGDSHYSSKPSVANLGNNEILCAFYQDTVYHDNNDILARNIYAVRSTDGGVTWQNQTPTPVYTGPGADFWPSLIKLSDGRVVCAFTTSDGGSVDQLNIEMVISSDRGCTWGSPQMISMAGHSETWPAIAQRPDGSLIAVWDSDPSQVSNVYYLYSSRLIVP